MKVLSIGTGLLLALGCLVGGAPVAAANPAPLDTLLEAGAEEIQADPRYAGGELNISRKLLPEAQATTVETAKAPKRPPRLDDPMAGAWHYHLARQAAMTGNAEAVGEHLSAALEASPNKPRYLWWQSVQSIKNLDTATLTKTLPAAFASLRDYPVERGHFVVAAHQTAILLNGIFWTLLVAALYLAWWRNLAHDMGATILKDPRHTPRWLLPLIFPLALLVFKPGVFGFLAVVSMHLVIMARGRTRALLLSTWVAALILVFPSWPLLRSAVPTVDPDSEVTLLDRACNLPPSGSISDALRTRLANAQNQDRINRLTVALGIQEARRGKYGSSTRLFKQVIKSEPTNFPALVGLANNIYYQGKLDDAAAAYEKAGRIHPDRGEIPYNLAQVYFKKLFVPEATEAMDQARDKGFRPPLSDKAGNRRQGFSPVVYPPLTAKAFSEACRFEAGRYPPLVVVASWRFALGAPPLPLYALVGAPLLLALFMIMWWNRQNDATECENCGTPLCRACAKIQDTAWLCSGCGETAERSRSEMVLATLLKNRSRAEGMAHIHRINRLGRLMPGSAHLAIGLLPAGWFRISLLTLGIFLVFAGWGFDLGDQWATPGLLLPDETIHPNWLPMPAALWPGWSGLSVLAGVALIILSWTIAFLDGPGLRKGIPDRYSLAQTPGPREPAPGVGIGMKS
jgi:tetratricopeptide (TPR) repeat protein